MGSKALQDQIASATERLAKLKAKEMLATQRAKAKAKADTRRADAHRKIELGGLVIAAGAAGLDAALLVGVLLAHLASSAHTDTISRDALRAKGFKHLRDREAARTTPAGGARHG